MRFFNFLRRVNRGIVLAILLIIGLACYLIVDNIAFKDEREAIKQVLEDYAKDMGTFLLLPEQYREIGVSVPDSVVENKIKENNELVNKYFTSENSGNNRYNIFNIEESIANELKILLKNNQESRNKIKSYEAKITKVKSIAKNGTSLVSVEAVMDITTIATRGAEMFNVFYSDGMYSKDNPEVTEDMSFFTRSYEVTFECEMVKRNGTWKFSNSQGMSTIHREA